MSATPNYDRHGLRYRGKREKEPLGQSLRASARALGLLVRVTFSADPWNAIGGMALEGFGGVAFAISALWLKVLADAVVRRDGQLVVMAAAGMAAFQALNWAGQGYGTRMRITLTERAGFAFDHRIATLTSRLPGLEHAERAEYQDRLLLLREAQGILGTGSNTLVNLANSLVRGVAAVVLLGHVDPILLLLPACALPRLVSQAASQRWARQADDEAAPHARLALHLYGLALHGPSAREARVFGLGNELIRRVEAAWTARSTPLIWAQQRMAAANAATSLVFALGFVGAVLLVVDRAAHGRASAGDVLLTIALASQVSNHVVAVTATLSGLQRMLREARRMVWLGDYADAQQALYRGELQPPARLSHGIKLDNVSFRYPGAERPVLEGLDLELPAGGVIALVGENGAGKTTLIKLLCRFYDPTEGRVLIDGVDLRELDVTRWRERIGGGFQDFCRFELRAAQAVGVGDLPRIDDLAGIRAALAGSGGEDLEGALPEGLATQLGVRWEGGVDLSGGQWQKLALARTLIRKDPLLLVLDEPTASLDAQTEHALFEKLVAASKAGPPERVTIIVSHRFSTVRAADHIIVLDAGRVREQGSHEDLVRAAGLYAELYELQARSYLAPERP